MKKSELLLVYIVVSTIYLFTTWLSLYVLNPLQRPYTPQLVPYASLLFLPHAVRVLSAWLLGWKSIPIMLPIATLTHWMNVGNSGFTVLGIIGAMSGVTCAAFSFWALAKFGMDFRISSAKVASWRDVFLAGCFASVLNTFGMGIAFGHDTITLAGYFVGDITGMFAGMLILMLLFKLYREIKLKYSLLKANTQRSDG